jgi:hypothetical protein
MPDEDVLAFAIQDRRAVLTLNRKHFIQLHSSTGSRTEGFWPRKRTCR